MSSGPQPAVVEAAPEDEDGIVDVLGEAFRDYPVMRWVLGTEGDYGTRLRTLVRYFVHCRFARGEVVFRAVRGEGDTVGAALVSVPERRSPSGLGDARARLWEALGTGARERYELFGGVAGQFGVARPHLHLNMVGVVDAARGRGVGGSLLEAVHALSERDHASEGVSLTTEMPSNVDLYRALGYHVVGSADVAGAFSTWAMFREDSPSPTAPV